MLEVVILAIVQGLTEFLPVSSDGHLVLAGYLLGAIDARFLDLVIFLHGGSLAVLLVYYRKDLWALASRTLGQHEDSASLRRLFLAIVVATMITGALGILLKDRVASLQHPSVAALGLLFTGIELLSLRFAKRGEREEVGLLDAVIIALFQTLAILPGVSRSGSTIAVGIWLGLAPAAAARYSFLLAIPAIGGALLLDAEHFASIPVPASQLAVALAVCTFVSAVALYTVLHFVQKGRLSGFGAYCVVLGTSFLIALALGG